MDAQQRREARLSRRRVRELRNRALGSAEEREARLARRRVRDRARRGAQSTAQREALQCRRESDLCTKRQKRVQWVTTLYMMAPSLSFISETSHSSSFHFVPAISRQLDKTVTFTPHTIYLRMRSLHVHVATQHWHLQSTLPPFSCKGSPHNACISTSNIIMSL